MNMGAKIDKNEQINKFFCIFLAVWTENKKRDALTSVPFPVIRLGLEPKTYCLEDSILLPCFSLIISMLMNSLVSQRSTIGKQAALTITKLIILIDFYACPLLNNKKRRKRITLPPLLNSIDSLIFWFI